MRFSTTFIAAGLTATVLAAPIVERDDYDDCDWEPEPSEAPSTIISVHSTSSLLPPSLAVTFINVPTSEAAVVGSSSSISSAVILSTATVEPVKATSSASVIATSSTAATTSTPAVTASAVTATTKAATASRKFTFVGADESGAEFGTAIPGSLGSDYTWPSTDSIGTLMSAGMNSFRIPFLMERMTPGSMTSALDATYLSGLKTVVTYITGKGGYAVIDPHNFGRFAGSVFTSTSDFQTFWENLAREFASNANVVFDCNNEFHDEPSNEVVAQLNQACIDGVRAAGALTQYIFVEGTSYTGAWTWVSSGNGDAMLGLTDPSDKIVYEMHQYLDSDGSGTSETCVSSTIGAERIASATAWLKANKKKGVIGEFAGGANSNCEAAITGMLDALSAASDVWMGALWWGGGPWWGTYMYSLEPPSGTAYVPYIDILKKYV